MKFLLLLLHTSFIFIATSVCGQGISNYNLYTVNQYAINPAYTGSQNGLYTLLHFKNHLSGINNQPRNLMFVAHAPIGTKLGLGGNITAGQAGVFNTTAGSVASSYKLNLATDHRITFGLSGGFVKQSLAMDRLGDVDLSDPTLTTSYTEKAYYKFGFGGVYNWKDLEVSMAFPNALQQDKNLLSSYFIGYASYKIATKNEQWKIQPSILYKSLPVTKDQLDIYMQAQWNNLFWALAGYRTNNNLIFGGGITIENMNIGYAYEAPTGTKDLSRGTHEVVLTFLFKKKSSKVPKETDEVTAVVHPIDSTSIHIKELEADVHALKEQIGEISHYIAVDSVSHTKDSIITYNSKGAHVKLPPGNYLVIQNCKTHDFADKLVKMYKSKGINTFKAYNETQTVFYIIEKYFPTFEDAKHEMEKLKKKGYKNSWVMVY
jgi:type IX secretion system PorP/SprF family membrane protein